MSGDRRREFFEEHYWSFLRSRDRYAAADQPVLRWWLDPSVLNEVDARILQAIRECEVVLDVGAGDLTVKRKLAAAGFAGTYLTLDPSRRYEHDFRRLEDVAPASCDAVVCLEVIEHLPLEEFFDFMDGLMACLKPGGTLVVSTPNAEFVADVRAADMTHVHAYRGPDLAAFLQCHGFESELYRVAWRAPRVALRERVRYQLARVITRLILQVDYARGILLVARRSSGARPAGT